MNFDYFSLSHPGRLRANNEDSVTTHPEAGTAVLADGMGGYNAGEIASAMATSLIRQELDAWLLAGGHTASPEHLQRAMQVSVGNANLAICHAARDNPQYRGMGTTLVMAVLQPGLATVGHVGDSRCYLWRGGSLRALTRDHSLLQEQIDAGLLSPQDAFNAPHKNLVTRALGVETDVRLDVQTHALEPGDVLMLCSDGLNDMLRDEQMAEVLAAGLSLSDTGHALVQAANSAGGRDNISLIMVRAEGEAQADGLLSRWFA